MDFAATLPKTRRRRRKPLPPGFKVAAAQVVYCHAWAVYEIVRWFRSSTLALVLLGMWIGLAWMRPLGPHHWFDVIGCVPRLKQYWCEWRGD